MYMGRLWKKYTKLFMNTLYNKGELGVTNDQCREQLSKWHMNCGSIWIMHNEQSSIKKENHGELESNLGSSIKMERGVGGGVWSLIFI